MKKKKIPMRKCIISNEMHPKKDMIRVVINKEGEIFADATGKKQGRGAYVNICATTLFLTSRIGKYFTFFIDDYTNHIFLRMHFIRYDTFTHWNFFLFHVQSSLQTIFLYLYLQ